ncbi:MAG: STAS domain-containing protein [Rubricoccaceae bacterium]|nr:STAS domain-containing protein [Rubricoccaceae bacterium]
MSSFSVSFRPHDARDADGARVCVLDLTGELDAHTAGEFEAALQKCLDDGHTRLVVSGRELQYISSAGLGVFMAFVEPVREQGGDIKIAELQPRVFNVFDLLGFPLLFDIVETEEAAVTRFTEGSSSAA